MILVGPDATGLYAWIVKDRDGVIVASGEALESYSDAMAVAIVVRDAYRALAARTPRRMLRRQED